ncbi:hypothetical protein HGRIS_009016 [Hohenbuehelia grisea]|uniref:SH3 domain-containing protein n=1 Tax=Hohenbuehelia grisea TaxID=104357 RepID=A0ABR3IZV4_9AGAR
MQAVEIRRPQRQDTFDLRDQIVADHHNMQAHADSTMNPAYASTSDEEHSVLEDDSDGEEREMDYMDEDDDVSSDLSIPNESIDFDLVYSLHSFAATVEGQANVVKGDSLFLMDDSNSYWWLVRVLKTQEVGYIPAENIETPFERLARLNKHRNVDLAAPTDAEKDEPMASDRLRVGIAPSFPSKSPSPIPSRSASAENYEPHQKSEGVAFTPALSVHRYPPAVWNEEEEEEEDEEIEWDDEGYEDQDHGLAAEMHQQQQQRRAEELAATRLGLSPAGRATSNRSPMNMEPDDGMQWEDSAAMAGQGRAQQQNNAIPASLRSGGNIGGAAATYDQIQAQERQQQIMEAQAREIQRQQHQQQQQEQQRLQQERQQQLQQQPGQNQQGLSKPSSREQLDGSRHIDPLEATETRKLTVTPTIVRDEDPEEAKKRAREEEEEATRKRGKSGTPTTAQQSSGAGNAGPSPGSTGRAGGGKLRKEREPEDDGKDKKKKSMFGGLFNRNKKDKSRERNLSVGSMDSNESQAQSLAQSVQSMASGRVSEESARSGSAHGHRGDREGMMSPVTATAMQQQQAAQALNAAAAKPVLDKPPVGSPVSSSATASPQAPSTPPQVSSHASQLRQRDQQQQALYQQYLNRSPSSPPEAQPSYGLQSAPFVNPPPSSYHSTSTMGSPTPGLGVPAPRQRPGSLILSGPGVDGQGTVVPELSVIRVFAGKHLQTDATFKTVLLNSSTSSAELVRQAIQRFRLPAGEDQNDYYLTVKQVEGGASAVLRPTEHPLVVFETLVEAAMEMPKVKRSSVGSISSVASNLSMHPAIRKLPMNDFTDDSAVRFYLNRRGDDGSTGSGSGEGEGAAVGEVDGADDTLVAETSMTSGEAEAHLHLSPNRSQYLSVGGSNVTPERFTSPSFRFALRLIIYPEDLPEDMVFDPLTEAIVFKGTLKDRPQSSSSASTSISQAMRRKVFMFPKNVTVAEVIEQGLERFGILEGVVDGGDEVEDKMTKRRSSSRVRYNLIIDTGAQERELSPSSRVIEAFPRPPTYRTAERRFPDSKRRSVDSTQLLGTLDDVGADDPVFILRRAIAYRSSTSRHRLSAPLDEIALQHLHQSRESTSTFSSDAASPTTEEAKRHPTRQEIIAAQRRATQANQRAILSAQTNSVRGVDVLLPGNAMLRSSRYDSGDRMRYSYVQPDGETYDISDIIEEEWQESNASSAADKNDLLEGVLVKNKDALGDKIDRVLNKIKNGKAARQAQRESISQFSEESHGSLASASASEYSLDNTSRSVTPGSAALNARSAPGTTNRGPSPLGIPRTTSPPALEPPRPGTVTPTQKPGYDRRQPSITSVMTTTSGYATPVAQFSPTGSASPLPTKTLAPKPYGQRKRVVIPKDDFGLTQMMAVIEFNALKPTTEPEPPIDPVDKMLFGRPMDLNVLHPQIREVYRDSFKELEEMDKYLDECLLKATGGA